MSLAVFFLGMLFFKKLDRHYQYQAIQKVHINEVPRIGGLLIIISIIALILFLDTFKNQISIIFPGILKMSDSLYLVINDLKLFVKDLVR